MDMEYMDNNPKLRTLWCGNLSSRVSEELLYELFLQAGPLESITLPKDRGGVNRGYAFITFKHECSVPYAINIFEGTALFDKKLRLSAREAHRLAMNNQGQEINPMNINFQVQCNTISPLMQQFIPSLNVAKNTVNNSLFVGAQLAPTPLMEASLRGQWNHHSLPSHNNWNTPTSNLSNNINKKDQRRNYHKRNIH